jgi:hypothetical protein
VSSSRRSGTFVRADPTLTEATENLMSDKTTAGYSATTDEIEGMLRNLCAYALSDPEPLQRYIDLTHQQVLFDGVVAAIRRERGKALCDLLGMGVPQAKVAEMAKLDPPQQVKALVTAAGLSMPSASRRKASTSRPAAGPVRSGAPMLPPTVVPTGKRTLTAEERRALGLPDLVPLHRERSMASSES